MARSGRKRKPGQREPSGRLQRPTQAVLNELNAQEQRKVKTVVLMQPHRNGNEAKECATALGRFWLALKTDNRITLLAGEEYAGLVRRWRAAWELASGAAPEEGAGTGDGPADATVRSWRRQIDAIEAALTRASCAVRFAVNRLVIDDRDLETRQSQIDALAGLRIIALELGMLRPDHPFR